MLAHFLIALLMFAGQQAPAAGGALKFTAPAGWQPREASSSMRVAEFVLPGANSADGKSPRADAELVVYFFGGSGGSVDANVQRWLGQMQQPDGRQTKDIALHDSRTVNGLRVSTLDVSGTYVAEVRPGSSERHNSPGFRMRTAVVDTPRGPYYIKLVGPASTIATWDRSYNEFLDSLTFAQ
jgi:hypothetical protein